jgi:hypothetical protein
MGGLAGERPARQVTLVDPAIAVEVSMDKAFEHGACPLPVPLCVLGPISGPSSRSTIYAARSGQSLMRSRGGVSVLIAPPTRTHRA